MTTARSAPGWLEVLSPLYSHRFDRDFRVSRNYVSVNPRSLEHMRTDLAQILRLADVANRYDKQIAHATSEAIRQTVPSLPDEVTPEVATRFLSLMDHPARLGELLRNLHAMGALEIIIPSFEHARSLLQFNEYHKYTVDEHCLARSRRPRISGRTRGRWARLPAHQAQVAFASGPVDSRPGQGLSRRS